LLVEDSLQHFVSIDDNVVIPVLVEFSGPPAETKRRSRMSPVDRRGFLKAGGVLLGAGAVSAIPATARASAPRAAASRPYFPRGGRFQHLYVVDDSDLTVPEGVLVGTLQGLVARDRSAAPVVSAGLPHVYVTTPNSPTSLWLADLQQRYGVGITEVDSAWDLLARYRPHGISGYVLYDEDSSMSVATTLGGITGSVAVHASIEDRVTALGLGKTADVRGKDDAWLKANYWGRLRHDFAVEQKPSFGFQLRDLATMAGAPLFYDGNTAFRDDLVRSLDTDAPVIGWGDASNGEDKFVSPSSMAGSFMVAADWGRNLSTLSGVPAGLLRQHSHPAPPRAERGVHYVSFVVTDGDNVQWLLTSLQNTAGWWASPQRGTVPLGWGIPPTLVDLAPSVMQWYYDDASTGKNADEFVVGPSGSGYMYPSQYPAAKLAAHTARLDRYMARADLGVVQILDFNALDKVDVWDAYTARRSIDGLIYLEYSRYDGGNGEIVWSHGKPVISARHMLWDGLTGADETSVTAAINAAPRDPTSADGYTLVAVHAWSKGIANIREVTDNLGPDVRVVTPGTFTNLIAHNVDH
jgi:hypothetical protein